MPALSKKSPPKRTEHGAKSRKASTNGSPKTRSARRESKTVAQFNRWLIANGEAVGKWARENTKRLTGKEIL